MRLRLVIAVTTFVCALVGAPGAFAASTDLFFSEYVEGSSNNKALEIFNDTGAPIDLTAGAYNVQMFFNGNPVSTLTINLTGTLADDDVFVLAHADAVLPIVPDQTNGAGWFNGDDAVVLRKGTTVLDVIGQIGFDPGTEWGTGLPSTADNTLRRESTIVAGDPTGSDAFDPADQWDGFAQNTFDGLGAHTVVGDAPFVASTIPSNGAADVPTSSDIEITFSEPVTVASATFSVSCAASGTHGFALSGGPTTYTLDPTAAFALGERCTVTVDDVRVSDVDTDDPPDTMAGDHVFGFTTVPLPARIFEIQGAAHISPLNARVVSGVPGVVTAVRPNSFTMQDALGDASDATSDAILVFGTGIGGSVSIGQAVTVTGVVSEFRPGGAATNLTTTEIVSPGVTPGGPGAPIPPTVLGLGGRTPPTTVIDDDATGDVETSGTFDPATDGIDFYESLEATLLRVNDPVVVGPTNGFGELWVLADDGAGAGVRTVREGVVISPGDFNPERIQLEDDILGPGATPAANVGDGFTTAAVGILDYNFGNFELLLTAPLIRVDNGLVREVTRPQSSDELSMATFNVENLSPVDPPEKFARLASLIVGNLGAPDLVALEEIQDNDGPTNTAVTDASLTLQQLIVAIRAAGGPTYQFRQIDPVDDQDGGQPGGNIRVGFLYRTDRGLEFVDRPGATSVTPNAVTGTNNKVQLRYSPGRIDPANAAWAASRKPLAAEFRFRNKTIFVIVNHFSSKGGDQPLFGRFQPPARVTEAQRHQQAQVVNDFVDEILGAFKNARVVVLGDLNDFEFSETLQILEGGVLTNLMDTLPKAERYSYVFEGNSQVLDQVLVSGKLDKRTTSYDVVRVNAEFFDQASDHDPQVARFLFDDDED